jgi:hypothetical protein
MGRFRAAAASVFLKMTSGRSSIATTPNSQTISVANTQVVTPVIIRWLERSDVISSATRIVTRVLPPISARVKHRQLHHQRRENKARGRKDPDDDQKTDPVDREVGPQDPVGGSEADRIRQ